MKCQYFFSDFDGTLTDDGLISSHFLDFLKVLKRKKIELIIVSGRSASWGHFFVTHFPVKYAVMEAGGVIITKNNKGQIATKVLAKIIELKKLAKITQRMRLQFPQLELTSDNVGRITDRAVELGSLGHKKIRAEVAQFLKGHDCQFSSSNVHLNYSTTTNTKWSGVKYLIEEIWNKPASDVVEKSCFAGDAPNDEIMFKHFKHSVGVNNIRPFLLKMKSRPSVVSQKNEIKGVLDFLKGVATL